MTSYWVNVIALTVCTLSLLPACKVSARQQTVHAKVLLTFLWYAESTTVSFVSTMMNPSLSTISAVLDSALDQLLKGIRYALHQLLLTVLVLGPLLNVKEVKGTYLFVR
jgi:hypothetical protein